MGVPREDIIQTARVLIVPAGYIQMKSAPRDVKRAPMVIKRFPMIEPSALRVQLVRCTAIIAV